jgi:hypothetical protein
MSAIMHINQKLHKREHCLWVFSLFCIFVINHLKTEIKLNYSAPRSKHTPSRLCKTSKLILCREIMAVCSRSLQTTSVYCEQNVEWECDRTDIAEVYIRSLILKFQVLELSVVTVPRKGIVHIILD